MSKVWTHEQLGADAWEGQPFRYRQVKEDGWRATLFRQDDGRVLAWVRDRKGAGLRPDLELTSRYPIADRLRLAILAKKMPPRTSLDCEIITPGARSDVITALKDPKRPIELVAFAVPYLAGEDRGHNPLSWAQDCCINGFGLRFSPFKDYGVGNDKFARYSPEDAEVLREAMVQDALTAGIEGWVLKAGGQCGKWYKVKVERTADLVVTDVKPARPGKYAGLVGSLEVSSRDGAVLANVSGMEDADRRAMTDLWKHGGRLVGRVCEVKYQMLGAGGKLVHPRFLRWREDKRASQTDTLQKIRKENRL